ncbi:MAG TPA: adenylate/guanylate cyclase domain-containing protein [Acidimicrobiales bacterium]|nr:adenylate/guanylate cyclase domain-containing protein [Acidimicrobiales bacterium]
MSALPTGTVTFLMSDVEGSTDLWQRFGSTMDHALARLDEDVHRAVADAGGAVIKSRGEGDSHFAVFDRASSGVRAAVELQRMRMSVPWPVVRIAIHAGEAEAGDGDYVGAMVNRTARLRSAAHGGQILCSRVIADLAEGLAPIVLKSLGTHRIRDTVAPMELFQVCAPGIGDAFPPPLTLEFEASVVMTVVIVDRVHSTRSVRLNGGTPDWQAPLLRTLRCAAQSRDGRFLKLLGDGCMVAFEDPRVALEFARSVCEQPALALRAAVTAGVVDVVEGELSGIPVFEAGQSVRDASVGEIRIAPVVHALMGAETPR